MNPATPPNRWAHRAALVAAAATFLMIVAGALVTTTDAGDSVPGWSFRFWEWFMNTDRLRGGQIYEMTHRQIGTVLGYLTIAMAVLLWITDRRKSVRWLAAAAVVGVSIQGGLGALRIKVVSDPDVQNFVLNLFGAGQDISGIQLAIRMLHATTAQAFFCLLVSLVWLTSKSWASSVPQAPSPETASLRSFSRMAMAVVFVQLLLGALVRHTRDPQSYIGPAAHTYATLTHIAMAFIVLVTLLLFAGKVLLIAKSNALLRRPAYLLVIALFVQLGLGFLSWLLPASVGGGWSGATDVTVLRTAHVAVAALLFAITTMLTLRVYRFTAPQTAEASIPAGMRPGVQT